MLLYQNLRDYSAVAASTRGPRQVRSVPVLAMLDSAVVARELDRAGAGGGEARVVVGGAALASDGQAQAPEGAGASSRHPLQVQPGEQQHVLQRPVGAAGAARVGRVAVYGDSNCADTAQLSGDCYWLVQDLLHWAGTGEARGALLGAEQWSRGLGSDGYEAPPAEAAEPLRVPDSGMERYSKVTSEGAVSRCSDLWGEAL